jgi:N-terminal acetyltransferase B complex catalytic subunit
MGKAEGEGENWHGHVSAVTVAAESRRIGLAKLLMDYLESVSDVKCDRCTVAFGCGAARR